MKWENSPPSHNIVFQQEYGVNFIISLDVRSVTGNRETANDRNVTHVHIVILLTF